MLYYVFAHSHKIGGSDLWGFDSLRYSLLIQDLWGLCFKPKESTKEIWQYFSFVLLAGEEIFFSVDICLKTLEVN
jgi:hypothetical protein